MIKNQIHPQTISFLSLFPKQESDISVKCGLSKQFEELWKDNFKEASLSYIGLTAKSPDYDYYQAETGGNDYVCKLYAHFKTSAQATIDLSFLLGNIPYPDESGEFVLRGNRYYVPVILCPENKIKNFRNFLTDGNKTNSNDNSSKNNIEQQINERETDKLHTLLLDELLKYRLKRRLHWLLKTLKIRSWNGDIPSLRTSVRRWLQDGKHTVLHKYIYRHGKLIDQANPLSRISQQKEMSFYYPGIIHPETTREFSLRDVNDNDLYRICPVQTPQGHKVGLKIYLARRASIDLNTRQVVAPEDPQPGDSLSDGASLIPFIEHDDISRALMGTNMMKQALPLIKPDAPLIQTGWETLLGQQVEVSESFKVDEILAMGKNLLTAYIPWGLATFEDGIVISESAATDLTSKHEKTFWFNQQKSEWWEGDYIPIQVAADNLRIPENEKYFLDEKGIVKPGTKVKPGDILVSAYMTKYKNINKTKLIDVCTTKHSVAKLLVKNPEEIRDMSFRLPYNFKGKVTKIIDSNEMPSMKLPSDTVRRIGIVIHRNEPAKVGDKIASRHGAKGVIVRIFANRKMPYLKTKKPYCTDDGCPIQKPHRHIQVILNPIGVTGRLNVGQLYETALAKIAESKNELIIVKPFEKRWDLSLIQKALISNGFSEDGKEQLYIFEKNTEIQLRYRSFVGPQYCLRLHHLAEDKIQARSICRPYDYTLRDNQPRKGKKLRGNQIVGSGQRIGEMETWALAGHAAWNLLDDLLTVKSDDKRLRKKNMDDGTELDHYRRPQALVNLILILRSLGLDLRLLNNMKDDVTQNFLKRSIGEIFNEVTFSYAKPDQMNDWFLDGEISSLNMYATTKKKDDELLPDPSGLLSRDIFDPRKPWQMGLIKLACPIVHPLTKHLRSKHSPEDYMLDLIAVLPIYFRNERLGFSKDFQDDLNILYRNILEKNAQLKTVLDDRETDNELRDRIRKNLYYAVEMLFSGGSIHGKYRRGIIDILKGKEGLIRGHMSGKRADYSGRAVIIGDPRLPLDEASFSENLWNKILPGVNKDEKPLVLLNRQPSLHRYSIQAFRISCHQRGDVVCLNPFVCKPFNADFDGDTIAIHVPRTAHAKTEAEKLIPSQNLLSQANGQMVLGFDKDLALAAAYITYHPEINSDAEIPFTSEDELALEGKDFWDELTIKGIKTTAGRLLLQRLFGEVPILNRCMDKSKWVNNLEKLTNSAVKNEPHIITQFAKEISQIFSDALKRSGLSLSLNDFIVLEEDNLPNEKDLSFLWLLRKIGKYDEDLEKQIVIKRGQMRRPDSKDDLTESIESCLMGGHTEGEYLCSAHGARAGLVDKGLITAYSGHLLRDLIYRLQHIYVVEKDCRTSNGLNAEELDQKQILNSRFGMDGLLIKELTKDTIFRSPLTCQANDVGNHPGICQKCYGYDPATGYLPEIGVPVGILAAQAIGERVSQETLKSFHTGGKKEIEKKGSVLVGYLRKMFSDKTKDKVGEVGKLNDIYNQFPSSGRPSLVHFEVILLGYKTKKEKHDFLSKFAHSQAPRFFFNMAVKGARDDLYDVVSRIVSGRMINTGPKGEHDA